MLPHFLVLLRTDTEPVRLSHCSASGSTWWADKPLQTPQSHWQEARLKISGSFPQEGPTMKNKVFIWPEWLGDYISGYTLHPHTDTCYTQSVPCLGSPFLMWMHCSGWANLKWFKRASWVLLSSDSTTHVYKGIVETCSTWDVLPNGSLPFLFSFPCSSVTGEC